MTVNPPSIPIVQVREPSEDILKVIPHDVQADFVGIPDSVYEALYGGAAYGGKSFILTLLPLIRGFYKYRGFKGIMFRRELTDLEKEIVRLSKEYFIHTGARYNEQKHTWTWDEYGSYFDFGHIQHLKDVKAYDTAQYNYCAFDELTHFEEAMYTYFVGSRVRPSSSFNISIVRNGTNPGGIGQTFVYNRFVKPCEAGYRIIKDNKTSLRRIFIPARYTDNPYGMQYDPDYANKLEILPEAEKRAKKYGDWHAFEGSVFGAFRPFHFPDEPDNACHICKYFDIPDYWPRILSVDWGKRAICHALWAAISPDERLYIYRERWWKGQDIPVWGTEIGQISEYENIELFILCGSGWQEHGSETIASQVRRYTGLRPRTSENTPGSRVSSLQTVHDFIRWQPRPVKERAVYDHGTAEFIYRRYGEEALSKYVQSFKEDEPELNLPRLQILAPPGIEVGAGESVAPLLQDTIPMCVYDDKRKEDVAEFDGDDPIDNLRYLCKFAMRYMNGQLGSEVEEKKKVNEIIQEFKSTGDTNRYYRRLEYLESAKEEEVYGVRRRCTRH